MNKIKLLSAAVVFFVLFIAAACDTYDGTIRDGVRNITIDVDNRLFREPDAAVQWEQGPGVDTVTVTVVLESGNTDITLSAADITGGDYTQVEQEVSGKLLRIDAAAVNAAGNNMIVSIDDKPSDEEFAGWQTFANLQRFRLGFNGYSADGWASGYMTLDIAPRGGTAMRLKIDSGVTAVAAMTTDWGGDALTSGQLAVEPVLCENPAGLSFDIYTLIVDSDLRELYKPGYITQSADYEYYPWEDVWSYEELTAGGKQISDTVYTMTKYNDGESLSYSEPSGVGCGYNSFLIDLSAEAEDPAGRYLMIALVSKYDVLSVPSAVDIIEIR